MHFGRWMVFPLAWLIIYGTDLIASRLDIHIRSASRLDIHIRSIDLSPIVIHNKFVLVVGLLASKMNSSYKCAWSHVNWLAWNSLTVEILSDNLLGRSSLFLISISGSVILMHSLHRGLVLNIVTVNLSLHGNLWLSPAPKSDYTYRRNDCNDYTNQRDSNGYCNFDFVISLGWDRWISWGVANVHTYVCADYHIGRSSSNDCLLSKHQAAYYTQRDQSHNH